MRLPPTNLESYLILGERWKQPSDGTFVLPTACSHFETGRDAFNPFLDPRKLIQSQMLETLKTLVNADCEFLVRSHLRRVFTCFCQELKLKKKRRRTNWRKSPCAIVLRVPSKSASWSP